MHELSLAMSLVDEAENILNSNSAKRATSLTVELGPLSGVDKGAFEFAFPEAIRGTKLQDCQLQLVEVPLKVFCEKCNTESTLEGIPLHCPKCFQTSVVVRGGNEFKMTQMEIE